MKVKPIEELPSVYPENPDQEKRCFEIMDFVESGERLAELERYAKTAESDRAFYLKAVRKMKLSQQIKIVTRKGKVIAENLRWNKERKEDETVHG